MPGFQGSSPLPGSPGLGSSGSWAGLPEVRGLFSGAGPVRGRARAGAIRRPPSYAHGYVRAGR